MSNYTVSHRPGASRGEFVLEQGSRRVGYLDYSLTGDTMRIHYVEVDPSLRGTGLGRQLIDAAVVWARQERRRIVPICSYARAVLQRTPAFADVLTS
jgi:predicted GNAT family acetyltransferase